MNARLGVLKGLLVAASESAHSGNRAVASNLMEVALDELEQITPEDLEVNLQFVEDAPSTAEDQGEETPALEDTTEVASGEGSLYSMVSNLRAQARG